MSSDDSNIEISMKPFQDFYGAKEWFKAMQWLEANKSHLAEGLYFFNMGVVSIKLDQLPQARYFFELSKLKGFTDPWVNKNIESLRKDLGVELVETQTFFQQVNSKLFTYVAAEHILAITLSIILAIVMYWWKSKIRKNFYTLLATLCLTIIAGSVFLNSKDINITTNINQAIIIEQMSIYEGPSTIFEELGKLPAGLKITWDENKHGWAKITHPVNFRGWIQFEEKYIKVLK